MRKALVAIVVLAGVLLAADLAARARAEAELRERVSAYYRPSAAVSASIRSFPFLGRLLLDGEVRRASVTMSGVQADALLVDEIRLVVEDVLLDRDEMLRGRLRLLDVGSGTVDARIDGASLARAAGVDVRFSDGVIEMRRTIRGVEVVARARASLEGDRLRLTAVSVEGLPVPVANLASLNVSYEIPGVELMPCAADLRPVQGGLLVSCAVDDIPRALVELGGA